MEEVVIFGIGIFGKMLYEAIKTKVEVVAFLINQNSREIGNDYNDIPIFNTNTQNLDKKYKQMRVFVAVATLHNDKIIKYLKNLGFNNIYDANDTLGIMPRKFLENIKSYANNNHNFLASSLLDTGFKYIEEHNKQEILKVYDLLDDEKSKKVLDEFLTFKRTQGREKIYPDENEVQYFPSDIELFKNVDRLNFIDCGAFDGDTVVALLKQNIQVDTVVSFEPSMENFRNLVKRFEVLKKEHKSTDFFAFPLGVWSKNKILYFNDSGMGNMDGTIGEKKDNISVEISTINIDETLFAMKPNYIKMDIEGSEKEALLGGGKTISAYKPILAISLYHKHEDIWELPLLIHGMNPNYKMYIRTYGYFGLETVLYCVDNMKEKNES